MTGVRGSPQERLNVRRFTVCANSVEDNGLLAKGAKWLSVARGRLGIVRPGANYNDTAFVIERGSLHQLPLDGGYASFDPVVFQNGATVYRVSAPRGARLLLQRPGAPLLTLGTSEFAIDAFGFTPAVDRMFVLDSLKPGVNELHVVDNQGDQTVPVARPFAAWMLVRNEEEVIIADTISPTHNSILWNRRTLTDIPLRPNRFPIAVDSARTRVLMVDTAGTLFWLSGPMLNHEAIIGRPPEGAIFSGDWL